MTGICGWYGAHDGADPGDANIGKMCAQLPRGRVSERISTPIGTIAGELIGAQDIARDVVSGLTVALDGRPGWRENELAAEAKTRGSAATFLGAYQSHGRDAIDMLSGAFAVAILDERAQELTLAIDRMGMRPLCFAVDDHGGVIFGTTTDAVVAHGAIRPNLSQQSIYDYIYFHVIPSPATIYRNISKLEPGQFLVAGRGTQKTEYFRTPRFETDSGATQRELEERTRELLRTAVRRCKPGSGSGGFLSGGLDSSTICGLASELTDQPFQAFTIGFDQEGFDEMEFARIAARHFGLNLNEYYVTPADIAESIEVIAGSYDEPFGNSSAIPALFCARHAKSKGVDTLLAGDGGDELFAGNERYAKQLIFEYYGLLPRWLRGGLVEPLLFGVPTDWSTLTRKAKRYAEQARVPMPERLQTYNFLHMRSPSDVFDDGFLKDVDIRHPVSEMNRWYHLHDDADLVNRMLAFDWKLTLADNDIRKVNRMCEVAGVEVVYPMLDDDLIEFSTTIPSRLKLTSRHLRLMFKNAMSDLLPEQILTKQKHGFGLPFGDWLATSDSLREAVMPNFERLRERGIFRSDFLDDLLTKHRDEHAGFYGNIIWVLVMLEYWLQTRDTQIDCDW